MEQEEEHDEDYYLQQAIKLSMMDDGKDGSE